MKFLTTLNPEDATAEEVARFRIRTAVRAIVYDEDNNIAILHVSKQNYHKLPGGGVEEGEDIYRALKRECQEELGCNIEIVGEIGELVEYRKIFQLKQISPCYLAKVVGEKGEPDFTPEELADRFQIKWVSAEKALAILNSDNPLSDEGRWYIVPRDLAFIKEAINLK